MQLTYIDQSNVTCHSSVIGMCIVGFSHTTCGGEGVGGGIMESFC